MSKDYIDAVASLNEECMNQACDLLLLNQHDDDHNGADKDSCVETNMGGGITITAEDQLLELYSKCDEAMKVIRKQQPASGAGAAGGVLASGFPGAPSLNGSMPAPRMAPRGPLPKLMNMNKLPGLVGNSKQGVIPLRRTALNKPGINLHSKHQQQQQQQQHQSRGLGSSLGSDSHPAASASSTERFHSKKQRLSPTPPDSDPTAPPPSALDFLAKLNKETPSSSTSGGDKKTSTAPSNQTDDSGSGSKPSDPGKRKNPPRGLQKQASG